MRSASKMSTPVAVSLEMIQARYAPLAGYTVAFETFKQDADPAPFFVGRPTIGASVSTGSWSPKVRSLSGGPIGRRLTWPATLTTRRLGISP